MSTPFIVLITSLFGWTIWLYLMVGGFALWALGKIGLNTIEASKKVKILIKDFKEFRELKKERKTGRA